MNTFDLQRTIRDAAPLSKAERIVLVMVTTYLPHAHPSWDDLAHDTGLYRDTVRKTAYKLRDRGLVTLTSRGRRPSLWAFDLAALQALPRTSKKSQAVSSEHSTRAEGVLSEHSVVRAHVLSEPCQGVLSEHTEETRKRQEEETIQTDTEISAGSGRLEGGDRGEGREPIEGSSAPKANLTPSQRLAAWADVWTQALGPAAGPLPTLTKLRATNPVCTEAMFSVVLADVAASVAEGQARHPLKLFLSNLKRAEPGQPAWTKEQILAIADGPAPHQGYIDKRRPQARVVTCTKVPPTPEQLAFAAKQARMGREILRGVLFDEEPEQTGVAA